MRSRYFRDAKGKLTTKAVIYERPDHGIPRTAIDHDARKICSRLTSQGHEAYIVGGAVRDLMLNRTPKDFDIATDASPSRVKKLFRNSRIIGKRFRLVHVYFKDGKILEVATFRAPESGNHNHVYGTLNEDVMRRDFSLNALYYCPEEETIIDFVKGVNDIRKGIIRSVLPLDNSFVEDPVRMLRAVKYAALTGMRIAPSVSRRIRRQASLLATSSVSRLSEELYKILKSGNSEIILRLMDRYSLFTPMLPGFAEAFEANRAVRSENLKEEFFLSLAKLDQAILTKDVSRGTMIARLSETLLDKSGTFEKKNGKGPMFVDAVRELKALLKPLVQPNRDVEEAVRQIFTERGLRLPRKRPRHTDIRAAEYERENYQKKRRRKKKSTGTQTTGGE